MIKASLADTARTTVEDLWEAANARVVRTSLRAVAREIGMSPSGLRRFLDGARPYPKTLRRLHNWFIRYSALEKGTPVKDEALAALDLLVRELPPEQREGAATEMVRNIARAYDEIGRPRPYWISQAFRRLATSEAPASASARRSARGRYRGLLGSTEEFLAAKREELDREERGAA